MPGVSGHLHDNGKSSETGSVYVYASVASQQGSSCVWRRTIPDACNWATGLSNFLMFGGAAPLKKFVLINWSRITIFSCALM